MTINKLIKELEKIQKSVGPRTKVYRPFEGKGLGFLEATEVFKNEIRVENDWGGFENKDGSERIRQCVIIQ